MRFSFNKITIIRFNKVPEKANVDQELQWLGSSLGLFNLRDKDKSCFRIFITLIKSGKQDRGLTSDELAFALELTRGTVVHHLNKLISAGIVTITDNKYYLRDKSLTHLVKHLKEDAISTFDSLYDIAQEIDKKIGLD